MKLLMIVGNADDIFIYNMAKWLKKTMDISIDIIEYNDSKTRPKSYDYNYYDRVDTMPQWYLFCKMPFVRRYTFKYTIDWIRCKQLKKLLDGRYYDVIHCHYVLGLYAGADYLKKYCNRLYFTFWGGEWTQSLYLGSNKLFRNRFNTILKNLGDGLVNSSMRTAQRFEVFGWTPVLYHGALGSTPLERIFELLKSDSRTQCKTYWKMPLNKYSVQLGYSGKILHQYLEIIGELKKHNKLKEELHLVAPMTRSSNENYTQKVRAALETSGFTYTLIDRHMDDDEMAKYRCSIDIVLQLSTFDGYSRSIVEALCSGSVVIYGEWLNYDLMFKKDGFEGFPAISIASGVEMIYTLLNDWDNIQMLCRRNVEGGKSRYVWSDCIKEWVAVYNGTAKPLTDNK